MAGRLPCKPRQQNFLWWEQGLVFLMTFLDAELGANISTIYSDVWIYDIKSTFSFQLLFPLGSGPNVIIAS